MNKRGFTLIELLVVIAIIGLLATVAGIWYTSARVAARDARRLSDLKQLGTALEFYNNDNNTYPSGASVSLGTGGAACLNSGGWQTTGCTGAYMGKVPTDPQSGYYVYTYNNSTDYKITAVLEGAANGLSGHIKMTPTGFQKGL